MPTPHHILVIDDEPFIGRIVRLEFERGPFQVSTAHDGEEGLQFLRAHPDVDLVLLDVNMPARSGLDLLADLRQDRLLRSVPVIMLTAAGQRTTAERARALGAAAFVTKPFSPKKLFRQVAALLGEPVEGAPDRERS